MPKNKPPRKPYTAPSAAADTRPEDERPEGQAPLEVYSDIMAFFATPYTIGLDFSVRRPDGQADRLAMIRVSPVHAKVMALALVHHVHDYELKMGIEISVPDAVLNDLGLVLERDWPYR